MLNSRLNRRSIILMGTVFFDSINEYLGDKPVAYYPFLGNVHSHPTVLEGSVEQIVSHAQQLEAKGVDGMDLLAYRHAGGGSRFTRGGRRSDERACCVCRKHWVV